MRRLLILSAAGLLAGCATPMIENPSWSRIPDGHDMGDAYPLFALMIGSGGTAVLNCMALPDGALADCRVVQASPSGLGFDRAALSLTPRFRINPRLEDGVSSKSRVQFPIRFRLPPEENEPIPPWTGPEPNRAVVDALKPMAAFLIDASSREEMSDPLDVDEDRKAFVENLMEVIEADLRDQSIDAMAVTLARLVTPEQAEALIAGGMPPGRPPSEEEMMAAGDRMEEIGAEYDRRLRAGYCARYECVEKGGPRSPSVNENGAVGGQD